MFFLLMECNCCFDSAFYYESCANGHFTCRRCIINCVDLAVSNLREIKCPETNGCNQTFSENTFLRVLDLKRKKAYDKLLGELAIKGLNNVVNCPKCSSQFIDDDDSETTIFCTCGFFSCKKCHKEEHTGDCVKENEAKHVKDEAATYRFVIGCSCGRDLVKGDGCMHVTCVCKKEWCWQCKGIWSFNHICTKLSEQGDFVYNMPQKRSGLADLAKTAKISYGPMPSRYRHYELGFKNVRRSRYSKPQYIKKEIQLSQPQYKIKTEKE